MEQVRKGAASASRTRSIAFVGLAVAIMAVSAWVTVPLGPVPFTLQMFAITFAIVMLSPKECIAAIVLYLALGAIGLPVFSGMSGGIAKLMGPTGGFLWGYIFGVAAAVGLLYVLRRRMGVADKRLRPARFRCVPEERRRRDRRGPRVHRDRVLLRLAAADARHGHLA